MDGPDKARLAKLLHRQKRRRRAPEILRSWERSGVTATLLADDRHQVLVAWLRANWKQPHQRVTQVRGHLRAIVDDHDFVIVVNVWEWDEAVAVLAPAEGLLRIENELRKIYPDGFLVADQRLQSALIVDFDDHAGGAEVSMVGSEHLA
jgi:hypothetical protein